MAFNLVESFNKTTPKLDLTYVFFISALHIGAVASVFFFSWTNLAAFLTLYLLAGFGITIGYHRMLTHRSFQSPKVIEYLFAILGNLGLEGGPITWVGNHRQHHKGSDTELDPHNIREGFWYAHMGWVFMRYPKWYEQGVRDTFCPDLQKDKFMVWLDKYHYFFPALLGVGLFVAGGWGLFLWGFCLRIVVLWHSTWFVNSAAHLWGYRYFKNELATNSWWVALVSLGEGWHNNHHKFPTSARHGLRTWEIDFSWIFIWTMSKLGLARKIKLPQPTELPWKKPASA
jgi:sn-2 palmitoyl-lipid 9-desaturase